MNNAPHPCRSTQRRGIPILAATCLLSSMPAFSAAFSNGDIFLGADAGRILHYDGNLNFVQELDTFQGGAPAGMAFDASGILYSTDLATGTITRFEPTDGAWLDTFGPWIQSPEAIVVRPDGSIYVSFSLGGGIQKLDSSGSLVAALSEAESVHRLGLSPDAATAYYTDEANAVKRWDLVNDVPLSNFATFTSGTVIQALHLLSDGGTLVGYDAEIARVDASGSVVRTYGVPGVTGWSNLDIYANEQQFLATSTLGGGLYLFDMDTGDIVNSVSTGLDGNYLHGLEINQAAQPVQGAGGPDVIPEPGTWIAMVGLGGVLALTGLRRRAQRA